MGLFYNIVIGKMANPVRARESFIMEAIFNYHPAFKVNSVNSLYKDIEFNGVSIEGGDLLVYTTEEMNNNGYEIIKSSEIISGKYKIKDLSKCLITLEGSELPRGSCGPRCMTMPVRRKL